MCGGWELRACNTPPPFTTLFWSYPETAGPHQTDPCYPYGMPLWWISR